MDLQSITNDCKITRVSNAVAAGTATTNCTAVDMQGWDGVCFIAAIGTIEATGTVTLHVEQSADNSSFSDLEGTSKALTASDDNELIISDIKKPGDRYVRPVIITATANGTIDGVIAIQYNGSKLPVSNSNSEFHVSPAEGTI